jgi:hypothetical protein
MSKQAYLTEEEHGYNEGYNEANEQADKIIVTLKAQRDELLEALEGLMVLESECWSDIRVKGFFELAKQAIAKAKGG